MIHRVATCANKQLGQLSLWVKEQSMDQSKNQDEKEEDTNTTEIEGTGKRERGKEIEGKEFNNLIHLFDLDTI